MSKHTETPWRNVLNQHNDHTSEVWARNDRVVVALCGTGNEAVANAEFIVRAVNAHDELLEALKEAEKVLETASRYFPKSIQNNDRFHLLNVLANAVRPAIAKAEGTQPEDETEYELCPVCGHSEVSDGYGGNDCPECWGQGVVTPMTLRSEGRDE
jgi:hypothetical protein